MIDNPKHVGVFNLYLRSTWQAIFGHVPLARKSHHQDNMMGLSSNFEINKHVAEGESHKSSAVFVECMVRDRLQWKLCCLTSPRQQRWLLLFCYSFRFAHCLLLDETLASSSNPSSPRTGINCQVQTRRRYQLRHYLTILNRCVTNKRTKMNWNRIYGNKRRRKERIFPDRKWIKWCRKGFSTSVNISSTQVTRPGIDTTYRKRKQNQKAVVTRVEWVVGLV